MAITASAKGIATTNEICNYISATFPYYKETDKGWKYEVRYSLRYSSFFMKVPFKNKRPRVIQWMINPASSRTFLKESFRDHKRKDNLHLLTRHAKARSQTGHLQQQVCQSDDDILLSTMTIICWNLSNRFLVHLFSKMYLFTAALLYPIKNIFKPCYCRYKFLHVESATYIITVVDSVYRLHYFHLFSLYDNCYLLCENPAVSEIINFVLYTRVLT